MKLRSARQANADAYVNSGGAAEFFGARAEAAEINNATPDGVIQIFWRAPGE